MNQKKVIYPRKSKIKNTDLDSLKKAENKLVMGFVACLKAYEREIFSQRVRRGIQAKKEVSKSKLI